MEQGKRYFKSGDLVSYISPINGDVPHDRRHLKKHYEAYAVPVLNGTVCRVKRYHDGINAWEILWLEYTDSAGRLKEAPAHMAQCDPVATDKVVQAMLRGTISMLRAASIIGAAP